MTAYTDFRDVGRHQRLDDAQRVITSDLHVPTLLERIVGAACSITDARFAAIALLDAETGVHHLVQRGLDTETTERLGGLVTQAQLASILDGWSVDGPAAGTEPGFLTTPVIVGDEHHADLYVAGPRAGRFTDEDRDALVALARSVAPALGHADLFERARRNTEWMHASGEIARALLAEADVDMFAEIAVRAMGAADADYGQIVIPTTNHGLEIIANAGLGAADLLHQVSRDDLSDFCRMITNGKTVRAANIADILSPGFDNRHNFGPAMIAPLLDARGTRGSIVVVRRRGSAPYSESDLSLFATYASQVALAMQFADARADAARLEVLETRHRTARELHDIVMQRLFATGVGLNSLAEHVTDRAQAATLARYVRDLDDTISEIRGRVFGLRGDASSPDLLASRFPRIDLDRSAAPDPTADATDTSPAPGVPEVPAPPAGSAARPRPAKRGRRRSDWQDGTGDQR